MKDYNSQFRQDEFLNEEVIKGYEGGFFVDVGAYNGIKFSNTYYFEKLKKWNGICVEPTPRAFEELKKNRNCICVNCAVFVEEGEHDFLWIDDYNGNEMLSGLKSEYDIRLTIRINNYLSKSNKPSEIIKVKTRRLESILDENDVKHIDLLSMDTENSELSVLKSIDFNKVFIECMVIENLFDKDVCEKYLQSFGYKLLLKINKDDFYLHEKSKFWANVDPSGFDKYKYR